MLKKNNEKVMRPARGELIFDQWSPARHAHRIIGVHEVINHREHEIHVIRDDPVVHICRISVSDGCQMSVRWVSDECQMSVK